MSTFLHHDNADAKAIWQYLGLSPKTAEPKRTQLGKNLTNDSKYLTGDLAVAVNNKFRKTFFTAI